MGVVVLVEGTRQVNPERRVSVGLWRGGSIPGLRASTSLRTNHFRTGSGRLQRAEEAASHRLIIGHGVDSHHNNDLVFTNK